MCSEIPQNVGFFFRVAERSTDFLAIIEVGTRGARVPPRFCNRQRSVLFIFKKIPLFLKESALEASCPAKFEMLLPSISVLAVLQKSLDRALFL